MRLNSIKLKHKKLSCGEQTVQLDTPEKVIISMSQHGGVPCTPTVNAGDKVYKGTLIGDSGAVMSAPVHSSISGTVTDITTVMNIFGNEHSAVVIEADGKDELDPTIAPPVINSRESLISAVKSSGLVGLGGAGFPTHIKLGFDRELTPIDTLIINGAECEPYITSDHRAFLEEGENIADGIRLVMKWLDIPRAVIGIENNKPDAVEKMRSLTEREEAVSVCVLPSEYPQGAEKTLIYNSVGRTVPAGGLPSAVGCLVMNCSTAAFIGEYAKTGIPLIKRRVTVSGDAVGKPANIFVPTGTRVSDILKSVSLTGEPVRAIFGGPMMGSAFYDLSEPLTKTCNALLLFLGAREYEPTACIRCGRCVRACSMGLMPTKLEHAFDRRDAHALRRLHIELCMNCGACSYVCPAKRELAEKNQLAKIFLKNIK